MTREEALQILKYEMQTHIATEVDLHIAMGMAIEALQTARPTGGDLIIRIIQEECCDKCHAKMCETCHIGRVLKRLEGNDEA